MIQNSVGTSSVKRVPKSESKREKRGFTVSAFSEWRSLGEECPYKHDEEYDPRCDIINNFLVDAHSTIAAMKTVRPSR